MMPPSRNAQYENALRRGNAMSRAPIINGTRKFAKPARIGTTTRKIIVVPWNVSTSSYEFFVRMCSFGVASCARIRSAAMPPPQKKKSDVQMYMIPIRLWSTVTSQLASFPSFHVTGARTSDLTATRARPLVHVGLRVRDQRRHLRVRPAVADRRHLDAAVANDVRECGLLRQQRVASQRGAVPALALHPVARGADTLQLVSAQVGRRCRRDEPAVTGLVPHEHARLHRLVEEPAQL